MSVTISTKVPEELAERIEEAQEEGESKSAAVRRLIRDGLDGGKTEYHVPPHLYAVFMGSVLFLAPITDPGTISGGTMMGLGALLIVGAFVYEFAL